MDDRVTSPSDKDLEKVLGEAAGGRGRIRRGLMIAAAVVLVLAIVGYALVRTGEGSSAQSYRTMAVTRDNLVVSVTATGNLQPTNQVDVGSELSGTIESVFVDDNDRVRRGQMLARLDTSKLEDQLANSRGALAAAQAQVAVATATVKETALEFERLRRMGNLVSRADLDVAEAAMKRARASEASARAAVAQARAEVGSNETNLAKASIRSPIDGVVLDRNIEPGQTVAASLQAPVLFTLAEDLSQMELQVDVDEADVGDVRENQAATFTVDAWPDRVYPARVRRVGFGSQTKDGVVSYLTVLTVGNDDLSLRPGMTATAQIVTREVKDALLVPTSALRFSPEDTTAQSSRSFLSRLMPRPPGVQRRGSVNTSGAAQRVWVLRDGQPVAVPVNVGASDGRLTEVTSGDLQPGMEVVTESVGPPP